MILELLQHLSGTNELKATEIHKSITGFLGHSDQVYQTQECGSTSWDTAKLHFKAGYL